VARTALEKRIVEERRAKGVLVPLLEMLLEQYQCVEDEEDQWFMIELMKARAKEREKGVFSPSMLSSCLRQSYFAKTQVEKRLPAMPRTNGYFVDGDFRHYKWQFLLWKLHRAGKLILLGCEVRVYHPNGDFAGTIDALVEIDGKLYVVDFKGMNVSDFQKLERYGTQVKHRVQIVGYGLILELSQTAEGFMGTFLGLKIEGCLLVGENKGGPSQSGSPLGLHEDFVPIPRYKSEVKRLMHKLRRYVDAEEIPEPACTSTRIKQYQECPFKYRCREEVERIQREREGTENRNSSGPKVAVSTRSTTDRAERSASGRKTRAARPDGDE
jgi:hypothetical protein